MGTGTATPLRTAHSARRTKFAVQGIGDGYSTKDCPEPARRRTDFAVQGIGDGYSTKDCPKSAHTDTKIMLSVLTFL